MSDTRVIFEKSAEGRIGAMLPVCDVPDDPIFDTIWHAYAELINHLEHFKRIKDDLHYHSSK